MTESHKDEVVFRSDMTVELVRAMASDASIVAAARVSTAADRSKEALDQDPATSKGLINFLLKNRHGTPFEHNSFTFFIEAPIFVFREFVRHRIGFSYNEESGRYRQLRPIFYVPGPTRNLVQVGKAGQYDFIPGDKNQYAATKKATETACRQAYQAYQDMLAQGVAREVARIVLPVGLYSSMYVTCNARSLMSFLSLRTKWPDSFFPSYPQQEIQMVAEKMEAIFAEHMPITHESFNKHGRVSP